MALPKQPIRLHFRVPVSIPSKGQCKNSKNFAPLVLEIKVAQNIFFPEISFAYIISKPKFIVCKVNHYMDLRVATDTLPRFEALIRVHSDIHL